MTTLNLQNELTPNNGLVELSRQMLNAGLAPLLDRYNQSHPLTLTDATLSTADDAQTAVLSGRSSYLGVPNAPVTARFALTTAGDVSATLKYQLRDALPNEAAWKFAWSFPALPSVWNYATRATAGATVTSLIAQQKPFVESLFLFDTYFVLATHAHTDPDWNIPLVAGLNFISRLRPLGALGVLENTFNQTETLTLYGPVNFVQSGESTAPLKDRERPWERPTAPGLHLQAPLGQLSLGPLALSDLVLQIYTPLTQEWLTANVTFAPRYGYAGQLTIPSAGITLGLSAEMLWNQPGTMVYAKCAGVSLGALSQLADVVGGLDLNAVLPKELQSAVKALKQLELTELAFPLSLTSTGVGLQSMEITLGLPSLVWQVWSDDLQVRNLACRFLIDDPLTQPTLRNAILMGVMEIEGVAVTVQASVKDNFTLTAWLSEGVTIPLKKLLTKYAKDIPAPSDLDINYLLASFSSDRSYSFAAYLADKPKPWVISVGKEDLTLTNLALDLSKTSTTPVAGRFSGSATLGNKYLLQLDYALPGDVQLRSTFLDLSLRRLIDLVANQAVTLPKNFDFDIASLIVLVKKQGNNYTFQAMADLPNLGMLGFEARRLADGKTGFAAGLSLATGGLSQLSGLKELGALEKMVSLQKLLIVVASFEDSKFAFPDAAGFNQPALVTKAVSLPSGVGGVKAGLNILAEWMLKDTNQNERLVKILLGLGGTEQVVVQVGSNPASDTRLMLARRAKINGQPFDYIFGVQLTQGAASLFLTGTLTLNIQKTPQTFNLTTVFVPSGACLSASMKGGTPIDCGPFQISNLGLVIGVNLSGVPSLGITANINVKNFSSSIALFFDSANPSKSLVAGAVSDLTLKDVVGNLIGGNIKSSTLDDILESVAIGGTQAFNLPTTLATDLNNRNLANIAAAFAKANMSLPATADQLLLVVAEADKTWYLTDLTKMRYYQVKRKGNDLVASVEAQLYFAPQVTSIGGITFPMGYYLNAAIEFLGFEAQVTIQINQGQGMMVDAYAEKLVIGSQQLFCLSSVDGKTGPRISIATLQQPKHAVPEFRPPHFYINGSLTMLGIKQSVLASATKQGLTLLIAGELVALVDFDLAVTVKKSGFNLSGKVTAGVDKLNLGALGKLDLDTDIEAAITLSADANNIKSAVEASFELLGEEIRIAKFGLDVKTPALANLGKVLISKAEEQAKELYKDADRWANAVKKGVISEVDDVEQVLTKTFGKSSKEAKKLAGDISDELSKGVKKTSKKIKKAWKKLI